jgi:MFS family permease
MLSSAGDSWKLGLIPQAIANGLVSILVLFFLISRLHGSLLAVGLVTGVSALALIPSQMLWGRLVDTSGRCKPFLVLGFVGMGLSFAAVPWVGSVAELLALVFLKSLAYAATLPARQLLTIESEERLGWRRGLANMQFLTSLSETAGMGIGTLTVSILSFDQLFLMCGVLCMISAAALQVVAREPGFMIQRRLVALERSMSTLVAVSSFVGYPRLEPQRPAQDRLLGMLNRSTKFLLIGIFGFSLAGSAFYSPLPAYFLQFFSSSSMFFIFFGGSLAGALCYPIVGNLTQSAGKSLMLASSLRIVVLPLLLLAALGATPGLALAVAVLAVLEGIWSLFDVSSMFAYLENAQVGRAGFYGALVGLGSAGGGFLGGYISMQFGFTVLFALCSLIYVGAFAAFLLQFRGTG